jgi:L-fuconate dehydratase
VRDNCKQALLEGYTRFKAKVGDSIENDKKRLALIREQIGSQHLLMVDANQKWDVNTAIAWMKELKEFKPLWIEEPTAPDDVLGHANIASELNPLGIGVATGEQCHNRIMFKQFFQANGLQFCQVDATRMGGFNEVLAVLLMANKFRIPVCPHAGGVGLCNYVQHIAIVDYIAISGSLKNRMTEFCDHLHENFRDPPTMRNGCYVLPTYSGYLGNMLPQSIREYEFPSGNYWSKQQTK